MQELREKEPKFRDEYLVSSIFYILTLQNRPFLFFMKYQSDRTTIDPKIMHSLAVAMGLMQGLVRASPRRHLIFSK